MLVSKTKHVFINPAEGPSDWAVSPQGPVLKRVWFVIAFQSECYRGTGKRLSSDRCSGACAALRSQRFQVNFPSATFHSIGKLVTYVPVS